MLPRVVIEALYAEAEAGYPEEVCGLIFARRSDGTEAYPEAELRSFRNEQNALHALDPIAHPRDARTGYSLGVAALLELDASFARAHPARIVYHSHVEVGAYLSETDRRAAAPGGKLLYPLDHLVIDVRRGGAQGHRLYRYAGGDFMEIDHGQR